MLSAIPNTFDRSLKIFLSFPQTLPAGSMVSLYLPYLHANVVKYEFPIEIQVVTS